MGNQDKPITKLYWNNSSEMNRNMRFDLSYVMMMLKLKQVMLQPLLCKIAIDTMLLLKHNIWKKKETWKIKKTTWGSKEARGCSAIGEMGRGLVLLREGDLGVGWIELR